MLLKELALVFVVFWTFLRFKQVTLSGLLNFVDGFHSCCGESRIIIFTMNYKGLDQALLTAGRVDTHICLSFCNAPIFAQLASTIWGFTVIICLMRSKDDKRDRGEPSKSGWRVDEEQYRSSSLFKALWTSFTIRDQSNRMHAQNESLLVSVEGCTVFKDASFLSMKFFLFLFFFVF